MEDFSGVKSRARSNSVRVLNFDEAACTPKWGKDDGQVAVKQQGRCSTTALALHAILSSYGYESRFEENKSKKRTCFCYYPCRSRCMGWIYQLMCVCLYCNTATVKCFF